MTLSFLIALALPLLLVALALRIEAGAIRGRISGGSGLMLLAAVVVSVGIALLSVGLVAFLLGSKAAVGLGALQITLLAGLWQFSHWHLRRVIAQGRDNRRA